MYVCIMFILLILYGLILSPKIALRKDANLWNLEVDACLGSQYVHFSGDNDNIWIIWIDLQVKSLEVEYNE
jgi:hypothetical protein